MLFLSVDPGIWNRLISLLPRLLGAGFQREDDFAELKPSDLVSEAGLSLQEAVHVLGEIQGKEQPRKRTALDLLEAEKAAAVNTFVRRLDEMLGMGVEMGKITEFCGAPGLGKTQLGIQLAVDVHLPSFLDGPCGHCVYIDTEGSFMPQRVAEIAQSFVEKVILANGFFFSLFNDCLCRSSPWQKDTKAISRPKMSKRSSS